MKSEIKIAVDLDENMVPEKLSWQASESEIKEGEEVKTVSLTVWDDKEKLAKRVDLWTKDMMVDDMKIFFYQNLMGMADAYERATSEKDNAQEIRNFANKWAEDMNVIKRS